MSTDLYTVGPETLALGIDNLSLDELELLSTPPSTPYTCLADPILISHSSPDSPYVSTPTSTHDPIFSGPGWNYPSFLPFQSWQSLSPWDIELWGPSTQDEHSWADSVINDPTCMAPSELCASNSPSPDDGDASSDDQETSFDMPVVVKVLKCSSCPSTFVRNYDLDRHERRHTGVKPYPCLACAKSYRRSDALRRHWSTVRGCAGYHEAAVGKLAKRAEVEGRLPRRVSRKSERCDARVMRLTMSLFKIYGNELVRLVD